MSERKPKTRLSFRADALSILSHFRAVDDVRYYLEHIRIQPYPGGGAVACATNGTTMAMFYDKDAICSRAFNLIVHKDALRHLKAPKAKSNKVVIRHGRLVIQGLVGEIFIQAGECIAETDHFPDFMRVVPKSEELTPGHPGWFNPILLGTIQRAFAAPHVRPVVASNSYVAIKTFGRKGENEEMGTGFIVVSDFPEFFMLVMPMRGGKDSDRTAWPDWLNKVETRPVKNCDKQPSLVIGVKTRAPNGDPDTIVPAPGPHKTRPLEHGDTGSPP